MFAPVIAVALVVHVPRVDGAGTAAVSFHLSLRPSNSNDTPSLQPLPPPTRGTPYLISIGGLCHEGLHDMLNGVDSGRYKVNEINLLAVFRVLRKQTCDRSRFHSFALKYATADREKLKLFWRTQAEAILLLGQIGGVKEVAVLLPLLDDPDWEIRSAALEAINSLADSRHGYLVYDKLLSPKRFTGMLGQTEEEAIMKTYKSLLAKAPPPEKK